MNKQSQLIVQMVVHVIFGTACTVAAGYLLWGDRAFMFKFMDSPLLSIGIAGSIVYFVSAKWGWKPALPTAILFSFVITAIAGRAFSTVWPQSVEMLCIVAVFPILLTALKLSKPIIGRLLLLGPLFAIVLGLTMILFRLFNYTPYMIQALMNTSGHYLVLGLGLGIGLEFAQLVTKGVRREQLVATVSR